MADREPRMFRVYVIKLKRSVWQRSARYRAANPGYVSGKPHVYVGSTAKTPRERLEQHLAGGTGSSKLVERFGRKLFEWAYRDLPAYRTREAAEDAEARKAEELRALGWGVWCNAQPLSNGLGQAVEPHNGQEDP